MRNHKKPSTNGMAGDNDLDDLESLSDTLASLTECSDSELELDGEDFSVRTEDKQPGKSAKPAAVANNPVARKLANNPEFAKGDPPTSPTSGNAVCEFES